MSNKEKTKILKHLNWILLTFNRSYKTCEIFSCNKCVFDVDSQCVFKTVAQAIKQIESKKPIEIMP
jgi:hypothetical protein